MPRDNGGQDTAERSRTSVVGIIAAGRRRLAALTLIIAGACSSAPPTVAPAVRAVGDHVLLYDGPELEVALGIAYASGRLGDSDLVLWTSLAGTEDGARVTVDRAAVSVRMPDRTIVPLMTQEEFRGRYGALQGAARRAAVAAPSLVATAPGRAPCGSWFFADPGVGFPRDVLHISVLEACDGPLFFRIPGGVQPGRWELEIHLRESVVEIPFELTAD
jgi:hypothetical protein